MVNELLINLKNYAVQYFLLTTIDHERFKLYMENFYYSNGAIGIDTTSPKSKYILKTSYTNGCILTDSSKDIFFEKGILTADEDENVIAGIGTLTIPD